MSDDDPYSSGRKDQVPGDRRPRQLLERAPAERYAATAGEMMGGSADASLHGLPAAVAVAAIGSLVIVFLNVVLAVTAGLIAVAAVLGYAAGGTLRGSAIPRRLGSPRLAAALIAVVAVLAAAVVTWVVAVVAQGAAVGPLDYLAQTMGPLLLFQVLVAAVAAWLAAR